MLALKEAIRGGLLATRMGLFAICVLAGFTAAVDPPALAQQGAAKTSKEFFDAYRAARKLVDARKFSEAVPRIDAAAAFAKSKAEKSAVEGMRVLSYSGLKNNAGLIRAIEAHIALGSVAASQERNYKQMLAGAHDALGHADQAAQLTKELIAEYGGTSTQLAYVAHHALDRKNYDEAVSYAQKAILQTQKEGKKPNATHYNLILNAYTRSGRMDRYYATLERAAPIFRTETYWRPFIERAKKEPGYSSNDALLDVYRALEAAGMSLSTAEKLEMGETALTRGMAIESERVLTPLFKAGAVGGPDDSKAERNARLYARARADAGADRSGGLDRKANEAASKATGGSYATVGESYLTAGDYAKAIDLIGRGIEKGQLEPGAADLDRLHLGIAQYKAGKTDAARETWSKIKADNGAAWLARVWIAISRT